MRLFDVSNKIFSADCDDLSWYVDNGATSHVCNKRSLFKFMKSFDLPHKVTPL